MRVCVCAMPNSVDLLSHGSPGHLAQKLFRLKTHSPDDSLRSMVNDFPQLREGAALCLARCFCVFIVFFCVFYSTWSREVHSGGGRTCNSNKQFTSIKQPYASTDKVFFQPTRAQLSLRKNNPNSSLALSAVIVLVVDTPPSPAT